MTSWFYIVSFFTNIKKCFIQEKQKRIQFKDQSFRWRTKKNCKTITPFIFPFDIIFYVHHQCIHSSTNDDDDDDDALMMYLS